MRSRPRLELIAFEERAVPSGSAVNPPGEAGGGAIASSGDEARAPLPQAGEYLLVGQTERGDLWLGKASDGVVFFAERAGAQVTYTALFVDADVPGGEAAALQQQPPASEPPPEIIAPGAIPIDEEPPRIITPDPLPPGGGSGPPPTLPPEPLPPQLVPPQGWTPPPQTVEPPLARPNPQPNPTTVIPIGGGGGGVVIIGGGNGVITVVRGDGSTIVIGPNGEVSYFPAPRR